MFFSSAVDGLSLEFQAGLTGQAQVPIKQLLSLITVRPIGQFHHFLLRGGRKRHPSIKRKRIR
jgi:hypothetical protein